MENKCLCKTCKNQDKYGYCNKLADYRSKNCEDCNGMKVCKLYDIKKVNGD